MPLSRLRTLLLAFLALASTALAQSAPTTGVLSRTVMIESRYYRGTAFSVDVDQREYWITAKHILTGAKHPPYGSITDRTVSLRILDPGSETERWVSRDFSVLDAGSDIDIVVLAPKQPLINNPAPSLPTDSVGITFGNDCEFLGFPYGGGWPAHIDGKWHWLPYTKHCFISTLNTGEQKIWVLDGINNEGFSGGPVLYGTSSYQKIFAVISGYVTEPAEVVSSAAVKKPAKANTTVKTPKLEHVNTNSGFIIAYDISWAIDAIHKNPIGPLHVAGSQ